MREKTIEDHLVSLCEKNDIWTDKYISGRNGVPDRILIYNGRHIFVEVKRPGEEPRKLQVEIHNRMRRHGAEVYVIDTKEKADTLIAELLTTKKPRKKAKGTVL